MRDESTLRAFRAADPAAGAEPTLSTEHLLTLIDDGRAGLSNPELSNPELSNVVPLRRPRRTGRRVVVAAAAVAAAVAIPILWPGGPAPLQTSAFAIEQDAGTVTITIPLNQSVSAEVFRDALAQQHLDATVFEASADCSEPRQDGAPFAGFFVAAPPVNNVQRITFHPDARPAGTELVFALEPFAGGTAASWWLTDQLPTCVPLSMGPGSAGN